VVTSPHVSAHILHFLLSVLWPLGLYSVLSRYTATRFISFSCIAQLWFC